MDAKSITSWSSSRGRGTIRKGSCKVGTDHIILGLGVFGEKERERKIGAPAAEFFCKSSLQKAFSLNNLCLLFSYCACLFICIVVRLGYGTIYNNVAVFFTINCHGVNPK